MAFSIRYFTPKDADDTARMLNESEEGWPGGLTGGAKYTGERVLDWIKSVKSFAPLVAESKGRIVGICIVTEHYEDEEAAYIEFLNVHPDFRGRGIGRSLLLRAIGESAMHGYRRVDLHTWSGNINAVPLYKKVGFFWVPRTNVYMQNYIPALLSHPLAGTFMEKHGLGHPSWYGRLERKLDLSEDDYVVDGLKAFPYKFRIGEEELIVVVDREARDISTVETPWLKVKLRVEEQDAPAGFPQRATWTVENKGEKPLNVKVKVDYAEDIVVGPVHPAKAVIEPGGEAVFTAEIKPSVTAEYREEREKAWRLRSTVRISDLEIPLCVGLRIVQPIEVTVSPHPFRIWAGGGGMITFNLRSMLREKCRVRLEVCHPEELQLDVKLDPVTLRPKGYSGVTASVRTLDAGTYGIVCTPEVEARGLRVKCKPVKFNVRVYKDSTVCHGFEGLDESLIAGNSSLSVVVRARRGSAIRIVDGETLEDRIVNVVEGLGPPYWPSEFERKKFEVSVDETAEGLIVRMTCRSDKYVGLTMVKEILIPRGACLVRLRYGFRNTSDKSLDFKIKVSGWTPILESRFYAVPLRQGVVRSILIDGDFPLWEGDLPKDPESYSEGWVSFEDPRGIVSAVMWGKPEEVKLGGGSFSLIYSVRVGPSGSVWTEPIYFYVGPGTWRNVSRIWRGIYTKAPVDYGGETPKHTMPVRVEASPLILGGEGSITIRLENLRLRPQSGAVRLHPPEGWKAEPTELQVEGLNLDKPASYTVKLKPECRPGAYRLRAELSLQGMVEKVDIPLLLAGGHGEVKVSSGEYEGTPVLRVDNGYLEYIVGARAGALFSLKAGREELLKSSYPKPRPYSWYGSWLGGICLFGAKETRWRWSLQKEEWNIEKAEWKGFKGVSAECTPVRKEHRELFGLKLRVEYLTKSLARFLLVRMTVENETMAWRSLTPVLGIFLRVTRPGGEYRYIFPADVEITRRQGRYYAFAQAPGNYLIVYNTAGWLYITLATDGKAKATMSDDADGSGGNLIASGTYRLKPKEKKTYSMLLAVSENITEARNYSLLAKHPVDSWFR